MKSQNIEYKVSKLKEDAAPYTVRYGGVSQPGSHKNIFRSEHFDVSGGVKKIVWFKKKRGREGESGKNSEGR